jgi:hypothetical protein
MPKTFTIEERAVQLHWGLMSAVIGLLFLAFGLSLLVDLTIDTIGFLLGKADAPEHYSAFPFAIMITIPLGVLLVWVFINPSKRVVFDAATQEVRVRYRYPFGFTRNDVFAFRDISPAKVVWQRNSDHSEDGYWKLTVTLPDGRVVKRLPRDFKAADQKEQGKAWQDEIEAMRR